MTSTINKILWVGDVREHYTELEVRHFKSNIDNAIKFLQSCSEYSSKESLDAVNSLRKATRPVSIRRIVGDYLAKEGYAELFVKIWQEYLHKFTTLEQPIVNKMVFLTRAVVLFSPDVSRAMGRSGALGLLLNHLKAPNITVDQLEDEMVLTYVLPVILVIQSAMYLCKENRSIYRDAHAISILSPYVQRLKSTESEVNKRIVKLIALLTLSYILNESETKRLDAADVNICLTFMRLVHSKDLTTIASMVKTGVSKAMILDGMNHVALLNDANKVNFVHAGIVPLLSKILTNNGQFTEEEQILAARGLWTLSFVNENREVLKNNTHVVEGLKAKYQVKNEVLRDTCTAVLWEIFEGNIDFLLSQKSPATEDRHVDKATKSGTKSTSLLQIINSSAATNGTDPQDTTQQSRIKVMISYQWDAQKSVLQLKDKLSRDDRFTVWMDVEKMKGSILASMAYAIEQSDVILVCLSRKYKESLSCRTEASYAYKRKKPLVPLMVEDQYDPDGWLGALVGVELYYNFSRDDQLTTEFPGLIQAIEDKCALQKEHRPINSEPNPVSAPGLIRDADPVHSWSSQKVAQWLNDNDLSDLKIKFCRIQGKHLKQMYKRYQHSPEVFDSSLKTDLQLDFITIVILTTALEELCDS